MEKAKAPKGATTEVRDEVRIPDAFGEEISDAEIDKIRSQGLKLLNDAHVHGACLNLVIARQLYNVALQSLNRRMDELGVEQTVERFLIEAMKHKSMEEFTRDELAVRVAQSTLPWITAEVAEAKAREEEIVIQELKESEQLRRKHLVPLSFRPGKNWGLYDDEQAYIDRDRTLSIAGHPRAVRCVIDKIMNGILVQKETVSRPKPTVLRAVLNTVNHNVVCNKDLATAYYEVGINRWLHCGRSLKAIEDTFKPFIQFLNKPWVDIVLIDDLALGVEPLNKTAEPWVVAGQCQRHFRKWADKYGTALVVGIPFSTDRRVTEHWDGMQIDGKWSQLETYTNLVQLRVLEVSKTTYQINAMQHLDPSTEITVMQVDRAVLEE